MQELHLSVLINLIVVVGTGGHTRHVPPHFSRIRANCPFSCNLVAFLESFEDAKTASKMHISCDFRGSKLQNYTPGLPKLLHIQGQALSHHAKSFTVSLDVLSPDIVLKSTLKKPCQGVCQSMCPSTLEVRPTSLHSINIFSDSITSLLVCQFPL